MRLNQDESGKTVGIIQWIRLPYLVKCYPPRLVQAMYLLINSFITIGLLAMVAMISGTPFVFPSLGPTAILLFFCPTQSTASPRNTVFGHAIGILCGYASLWLLDLTDVSYTVVDGVEIQRIFCTAMALASTGFFTVILNVTHPPAGATTLIIALGMITKLEHLIIIEAAVVVLVLQALVINRLAGIKYPLWT